MILTLVFLAGGHVHLEQPQNAMSWLEPVAQSFIRHIAFHCVVIAACCSEANRDKAAGVNLQVDIFICDTRKTLSLAIVLKARTL